jgi:predicted ABC-type ATPase
VEREPQLWIVGGPNGAGKSTIGSKLISVGPALDPDAICRQIRHRLSWLSAVLPKRIFEDLTNYLAVVRVETLVKRALLCKTSVAFETVLSSPKYVRHVKRARRLGFQVHMVFVALPSPDDHVERVAMRVRDGGHDVPVHKIRARWQKSHDNLRVFLPYLDSLVVFSNANFGADDGTVPVLVAEKERLTGAVAILAPDELPEVTRQLANLESRTTGQDGR